jgi:aerobic carbon-monoxide dehydrogenase medium subunit
VKPAPFEYHRPRSLDEALALLAAHGSDAKPLAGGQSLVPAMNFRVAQPAVLVDLNHVPGLDGVESGSGGLRLGAMVRHRTLEHSAAVQERAPLIADAMPHVAHVPIRVRGTLGGSLAHADPAAELPALMIALDATIEITRASGRRTIPASAFFTGLYATSLDVGELVTAVTIPPRPTGEGWAFEEVARRHGDFALAGAVVVVGVKNGDSPHSSSAQTGDSPHSGPAQTSGGGVRPYSSSGQTSATVVYARIALFGVHDRAVVADAAGRLLVGQTPTPALIDAAAAAAAEDDADPASDIHATRAFRQHLTRVVVRRALQRAVTRACRVEA